MIPLSICAFIGLTAICYKALALKPKFTIPPQLVHSIESHDNLFSQELLTQCHQGQSTLARLCAVAMRQRELHNPHITASVEAAAREEITRLNSGIGILDIVITVAPLLGLLGTASGLVTIFDGLSDAANHLAIAKGIATALNTTIFGLAIAVPAVIAHGYFSRKIEMITAKLESLLNDFARACQQPTELP